MNNGNQLFTDLYELTMMQGYFKKKHSPEAVFDLFFRDLPENRGYMVSAGLEQVVDYVENLSFSEQDLDFLREQGFEEEFLDYLSDFEFTGSIRAVPEGTPVFPNEPLIEVKAPIIQAQLLETFLINQISFQSLIATKASRIRDVVRRRGSGQSLIDFGSRRAHGIDAGLKAGRASYIGGFNGTSNVKVGKKFGIPVYGTMAHSWVQSFDSEREAFRSYLDVYGESSILLVDTYDSLKGAEIARDLCDERGIDIKGVRIDSGDTAKLSKAVDERFGFNVFVSSGFDEYKVSSFLSDGGVARGFGVGTNLVTSSDSPKVEGVYKLVEVELNNSLRPEMKLAENKSNLPGMKSVRRVESEGVFEKDVIDLKGHNNQGEELLKDVFLDGELVYERPELGEIRKRCMENVSKLPENVRKINDPGKYSVELGEDLENMVYTVKRRIKNRQF